MPVDSLSYDGQYKHQTCLEARCSNSAVTLIEHSICTISVVQHNQIIKETCSFCCCCSKEERDELKQPPWWALQLDDVKFIDINIVGWLPPYLFLHPNPKAYTLIHS